MIKLILIVLVSEIMAAMGQILFKKATNSVHAPHLKDIKSYGFFLKKILAKPQTWAGFALMTAGLASWLAAVSQADLSLVYPLGSIYYIFVLLFARVFLGEKVSSRKLWGTLLIMAGIAVISMSHNF